MKDYDFSAILLRLKSVKTTSGMTNEELSAASGVSLGTLSKILSGETKAPQLPAIMAIASALGVSLDYLLFGLVSAPVPLSAEEAELISLCRSLNKEGSEKVLTYAADLDRAAIYGKNQRKKK